MSEGGSWKSASLGTEVDQENQELGPPRFFPVGLKLLIRSSTTTSISVFNPKQSAFVGPAKYQHISTASGNASPITMLALLRRFTSPPAQTLTTFQPTPSTISFSVSTRPVPKTLPALLRFYVSVLVRIIAGIAALTALWTKWRIDNSKETVMLGQLLGYAVETWLVQIVQATQWRYLAPGALATLWAVVRRGYTGT